MNYPCSKECILLPICKSRSNGDKFHSCSIYQEYVATIFDKAQKEIDKDNKSSKTTIVMAIKPKDIGHWIDKNGREVKGLHNELK